MVAAMMAATRRSATGGYHLLPDLRYRDAQFVQIAFGIPCVFIAAWFDAVNFAVVGHNFGDGRIDTCRFHFALEA